MASKTFLHIEGVTGTSTDPNRVGWIDVLSFNWGIQQSIYGNPTVQDFTVRKRIDATSPLLAVACAEGRPFEGMTCQILGGPEGKTIITYKMMECLITGLQPVGDIENEPVESLTFAFSEIEWRYSDSQHVEPIATSFNIKNAPQTAVSWGLAAQPEPQAFTPENAGGGLQLQRFVPNTAFIVMWMDPDHAELEDVHAAIKEVCSNFGIKALRADDVQHDEKITDVILEHIRTSEFVIADLTGERPNVYYEVGHAHAIGKRPILVRRKGSALHFDLAVHNVREYRNVTELRQLLSKRLDGIVQR